MSATPILNATGLRLRADGTPVPDIRVLDLDQPLPDRPLDGVSDAAVLLGVADGPLSPAARALARELTCTLVPQGLAGSPAEVGVADPGQVAAGLVTTVEERPRAAVTLATLLRVVTQVPVRDGLALESAAYSTLLAGAEFQQWLAARPRRAPAAETSPPVLLDRTGDALHVVLNRPHRRNAFDRTLRDGLVDAFDLVLADPSIRRVTLQGNGPAFCSGGDLAEFGTATDVSTAHLIRLDRGVAARVDRCQDRVVARLHGACIGAGVEIPSFAGFVLARPDTFFELPELAMGLLPGAGGTVGVSRRIGRWRTAYLALSGARLGVSTALDWGLIDAVDDD